MKNIITIITKAGVILKFDSKQLRDMSRGCKGVRAIRLAPDDEVVAAFNISEGSE